jgi:CCR4-NOT transcription complex subunit 1
MVDAMAKANSLAAVMEEAGPSCSATDAALQDVLKHLPAPTEQAVGEVLGLVARTSTEGAPAWNVGVLVDGLRAANPALDWQRVAEHLDAPGFATPDASALAALMSAWRHATPDPFPLRALVGGLWANTAGQLSFLRAAAAAPPEVLSWAHAERRQEPLEGLHAGRSPTGTPNRCWMALDLYTTLAALADSGHTPAVRAVLEAPRKACPELLLLGAASVTGGWGPLQAELVDSLVAAYVAPHPNSAAVLARLWALSPSAVVRAMAALHAKDPAAVARALDVCQELRCLAAALDAAPPPFCLELAALAARREFLNLEKWLGEQCAARGVAFMQAAVAFLDLKLRDDAPHQPEGAAVSVVFEFFFFFFRSSGRRLASPALHLGLACCSGPIVAAPPAPAPNNPPPPRGPRRSPAGPRRAARRPPPHRLRRHPGRLHARAGRQRGCRPHRHPAAAQAGAGGGGAGAPRAGGGGGRRGRHGGLPARRGGRGQRHLPARLLGRPVGGRAGGRPARLQELHAGAGAGGVRLHGAQPV